MQRTPSIIEEAEENDELGESNGPKNLKGVTPKGEHLAVKVEDDEDFNFDVPDKLQITPRDNTIVKVKKAAVIDVLADIKKATNFVDQIVSKETPKVVSSKVLAINNDDQEVEDHGEDDEAQFVGLQKRAEYPFQSKQLSNEENKEEVKEESKEQLTLKE